MKHNSAKTCKSKLLTAAEDTPDAQGAFRTGLQAVKGQYRAKFQDPQPRLFTGSIDIDAATKEKYPNDNRWDYAIEYNNETFFVEIHPASTSEVVTVLSKLSWLKQWLKNEAPKIYALRATSKPHFHWVSTNRCDILKTSRQYKALAQKGIIPISTWKYSRL